MIYRILVVFWIAISSLAWAQSASDLAVLQSASQFFAGGTLTAADLQVIVHEAHTDAATNPTAAAQNVAELRQLGALLSQLQDPTRLVEVRQAALVEFYKAVQTGQASPATRLILERARPLAFDPQAGCLLLADDLESTLAYLSFLRQSQGGTPLSASEQAELRRQLTDNFGSLPDSTKGFVLMARVVWSAISQQLARLNQAQAAQFQQQLAQQTPMSMDTYQALSAMSRDTHLTTMNILENIGGSGDYWTVEQQPGW